MRGVVFKALFAVGLRACMMGGALVILGMVRIGVSLITLCCFSLTLCCSLVTLCSARGVAVDAGGLRMVVRLDFNNFNNRRPLVVEAATAVVSRSSSVRAHTISVGVGTCLESGSAGGIALRTPICDMLAFREHRIGCIGSGPLMVQDTIRQLPSMPMTPGCRRLHI